jgi:hypothetical protein
MRLIGFVVLFAVVACGPAPSATGPGTSYAELVAAGDCDSVETCCADVAAEKLAQCRTEVGDALQSTRQAPGSDTCAGKNGLAYECRDKGAVTTPKVP